MQQDGFCSSWSFKSQMCCPWQQQLLVRPGRNHALSLSLVGHSLVQVSACSFVHSLLSHIEQNLKFSSRCASLLATSPASFLITLPSVWPLDCSSYISNILGPQAFALARVTHLPHLSLPLQQTSPGLLTRGLSKFPREKLIGLSRPRLGTGTGPHLPHYVGQSRSWGKSRFSG